MIELNQGHPAFDLAMEVLCCLYRKPIRAEDLAKDFDMPRTGKITYASRRLAEMGFPVVRGADVPPSLWLNRRLTGTERDAAERYLKRVYG